jgi:hypothetical protein
VRQNSRAVAIHSTPLSGTGLYRHLPSASSCLVLPRLAYPLLRSLLAGASVARLVPELPETTKTRSLGSPALSGCSQGARREQWSPRARRVGLPLYETLSDKPRGRAQGQRAWASGRGVVGRPQVLIWWGARAIFDSSLGRAALAALAVSRAVSLVSTRRDQGVRSVVRGVCGACSACAACAAIAVGPRRSAGAQHSSRYGYKTRACSARCKHCFCQSYIPSL